MKGFVFLNKKESKKQAVAFSYFTVKKTKKIMSLTKLVRRQRYFTFQFRFKIFKAKLNLHISIWCK